MGAAEKVLTVTLRFRPDGTASVIGTATQELGRLGNATANAASRARDFTNTAIRQNQVVEGVASRLRGLLASVTALAGAGGLGLLIKRGYDYDQGLEAVRNSIAGILAANRGYVDSNGRVLDANAAFQAGLSETDGLLVTIQKRAIETAATVPQIGDAFQIALAGAKSSGLKQDLNAILETTVRVVQAASAFHVPLDQLRQEINSLFTGEVTQDSEIAKKLGFDNASLKKAIAAGTLYQEIIKRTEAISAAAAAQSNTLSGVIVNTAEMIDSTVAKALHNALGGVKNFILEIGDVVTKNAGTIAAVGNVITDAAGRAIAKTREWVTEHAGLLKEIAAIGLVALTAVAAYGAIGVAIAAITSPVGIAIVAIVALALAWEKVREWGEIVVGGRPLSAYIRALWDLVGGVTAAGVEAVLTQFRVLYHGAAGIFGVLADVILAPLRLLTVLVSKLPDSVAATVPGGVAVRQFATDITGLIDKAEASLHPLDNFRAIGTDVAEAWQVGGALFEQTTAKMSASLKSTEKLPSIADTVFGGIADVFRKRIAELQKEATKASKLDFSPGKATKPKIPDEVQHAFDEYLAFIEDIRRKGDAAGNAVEEAIANIEKQRKEALLKIAAARKDAKFNVFGHDFDADESTVNQAARVEGVEAAQGAIQRINEKTLQSLRFVRDTNREITRQITADRIAAIKDENDRALAEKLEANRQWFEDERTRANAEIDDEVKKNRLLGQLADEKKRRDVRDRAEDEKARDEQLVGFGAWALRLKKTITDKLGPVWKQVTDAVLASVDAVQGAFNKLFDGLVNGQLDLGAAFEDFGKQLGSIWSHLLSNMLTKTLTTGESITAQFRALTDQMNNLTGVNAALAGAGVGSLVGGIGQAVRPNSQAGIGGTIGGVIGAVIGSYFGATGIGAYVGSAIGTAIGSAIQKGKDSIQVGITNAAGKLTVGVSEKGISAEARQRLTRDITRQVADTLKSYQALIDLFPEQLRDQIRKAVRPINVAGGVESADITDENALQSLSTFLSETLQKGAFDAYEGAIRTGLTLLGVSTERVKQEMQNFGELQGKDLQDAVRAYITTLTGTIDLRNKFALPAADFEQLARDAGGQTQLDKIRALNPQIEQLVNSLTKLDVTDQIGAAQQINQLTQQKYEMEIAYLQRIDAVQKSIAASSDNLRDQIKLAGLDDQGKLDFDFEKIRGLRNQLLVTTDADAIQQITEQIQGYVSQALGLGANNAGLRDQLTAIVNDIQSISEGQLGKAREAVDEQHKKTADLLQQAASALMNAAATLGDILGVPTIPGADKPGGGDDGDDRKGRRRVANDVETPASDVGAILGRVALQVEGLTDTLVRVAALPDALASRWAQFEDGVALAVANLRTMTSEGRTTEGGITTGDAQTIIQLLTRIADSGERELRITGDGADMLRDWGFAIEERVIRRIRSDRDIIRRFADQ